MRHVRFVEFPRSNPASAIPAGAQVLGIEVTVPEQLELCSLGNIDPQHGYARGYVPVPVSGGHGPNAAIDVAMEHPMPPDGTVLASSRADLDSVGAMAVLVLRRLDLLDDPIESGDHDPVWERLTLVAERDSFRPSAEWTPHPLPTPEQPWGDATTVDSDRELAHLGAICSPRPGDIVLQMAERVAIVACWLLWGDPTGHTWGNERVAWSICEACDVGLGLDGVRVQLLAARDRVEASRRALAASAAEPGAIEFRCPGCGERWDLCMHDGGCPVVASRECHRSPVAVVRVAHAGALGLGYCVAPVVVAFDGAVAGKVTICGWSGPDGRTRYVDIPRLRARLNELESTAGGSPAWGGPPALIGSPQVPGGTRLSEAAIAGAVLSAVQ